MAASHAGEGKVVNAILTEEIVMAVPAPKETAVLTEVTSEAEAAPVATQPAS
jgi:hypothetical protein